MNAPAVGNGWAIQTMAARQALVALPIWLSL
jgi:hypothetical protein